MAVEGVRAVAAPKRVVARIPVDPELEVARIEIVDTEILEADRALAGVDQDIGSVLGDGQILETGNPRNLREVDQVFPVGKARDRVVSVIVGEYEDIIKAASDQIVVASRSSDTCHVRCSSCLLLVRRLADDEAYRKMCLLRNSIMPNS